MNQYGSADNGGGWWDGSIGNQQTFRDLVAQHAGASGFALVLWQAPQFGGLELGMLSLRAAPKLTPFGWTVRLITLDGAYRTISAGNKISLIRFEIYATSKMVRSAAQQALNSIPWNRRQSAQPTQCAAAL